MSEGMSENRRLSGADPPWGNDVQVGSIGLFLYQAARQGDAENLENGLRSRGAQENIDYRERNTQMTPLMAAAMNGHLKCVKLLLSHSADIHASIPNPRNRNQQQTAGGLAAVKGHRKIAKYLKDCIGDLVNISTTRAHLEADAAFIAQNPDSSYPEAENFCTILKQLQQSCGYTLDQEQDTDEYNEPTLLIRAAEANNTYIMLKLIDDFNATLHTSHPLTSETALHLALKKTSPARMYVTEKCCDLLLVPDNKGNLPLHIACENNDEEYVSWLFGRILNKNYSIEDEEEERQGQSIRYQGSLNHLTSYFRIPQDPMDSRQQHSIRGCIPTTAPVGDSAEQSSLWRVQINKVGVRYTPPLKRGLKERRLQRQKQIKKRFNIGPENSEETLTDPQSEEEEPESSTDNPICIQISDGDNTPIDAPTSPDFSSLDNPEAGLHAVRRQYTLTTASSIDSEVNSSFDAGFVLHSPHSNLSYRFFSDMRIFRKNTVGDTILHVMVSKGYVKLLNIILQVTKTLWYQLDTEDLDILTQRDGFTKHTPIELAILNQDLDCMRALLKFMHNTECMKTLLKDENLLKIAVFSKKVNAVKMLLEYGFHLGLKKAIAQADIWEQHEMLRILLYYYTQVNNALELATVHANRTMSLRYGGIKWDELNLLKIDVLWLYDSYTAIDFVSRVLNDPEKHVRDTTRYQQEFFQWLGANCLEYFNSSIDPSSPSATPSSPSPEIPPSLTSLSQYHLTPILEVNLSENQLQYVPAELFQMPNLRTLRLSHNDIRALPSSDALHEVLYSSSKLRKVYLDWNKLRSIPEHFCRGLGNSLEDLDLSFNELSVLPAGLWVMKKLQRLWLSRNKLQHLHSLSKPQYFTNYEMTQQIVDSFVVENYKLEITATDQKPEEMDNLHNLEEYLMALASFIKTVQVMREQVSSTDVIQSAIDVHWARYHMESSIIHRRNSRPLSQILSSEDTESMLIQNGLSSLYFLDLSSNDFRKIPWDLPCITPKLHKLDLRKNKITDLDIVHSPPANLSTLWLSENRISTSMKQRLQNLPCGSPILLLSTQPERHDTYCTHCNHLRLENLTSLHLDRNLLTSFEVTLPHLEPSGASITREFDSSYSHITIDPLFPRLSVLSLANNVLEHVPARLYCLSALNSLTLSFNPITQLPEEMGRMDPNVLYNLQLEEVFPHNIPPNELERGNCRNIISYLKSIRERSRTYRRIKLMVVGDANKGKTSLLLNLTKKGKMTRFKDVAMNRNGNPLATDGVELGDWEYHKGKGEKVTFMTWDFGGQEEYYATHQVFLTNRALYLLVWSITDGQRGLARLRVWLENIESRAKDSPVIVIATHIDQLSNSTRDATVAQLQAEFQRLYINSTDAFAFPKIQSEMLLVNCRDSKQVDWLRDHIYEFILEYKLPANRSYQGEVIPLLNQKVPEAYIKLQDAVRHIAHLCSTKRLTPILSRKDFITMVRQSGKFSGSIEDLDQAISFLNSYGILLHFDESQLNHLYFPNPQWLCSMLAKVITIRHRNPHIRDGIIKMTNLRKILHNLTPSLEIEDELISIMQKFGVMFKLDEHRLIIPSLLPPEEANAYIILPNDRGQFENSMSSFYDNTRAPISSLQNLLVRYYILPFIPNGFFPRLCARVLSSDMAMTMREALTSGPLEEHHILNTAHWECWREGVSLVWNHMEVLRIAPLTFPLPGFTHASLVTGLGEETRGALKGVEVKVAVLPDSHINTCSYMAPGVELEGCSKSKCLATWLLYEATELADSVFDDWYVAFGRKRNFDDSLNCLASPCPQCFKQSQRFELSQMTTPTFRRLTLSSQERMTLSTSTEEKKVCLFSCSMCCHANTQGSKVVCPTHGQVEVADVAPDLVFADLPPSQLFPDHNKLHTMQRLGDGGYGTVNLGLLSIENKKQVKVAVKEFKSDLAAMNCRVPGLEEETRAWEVYLAASTEARLMSQLQHPHILPFVGITFRPIRLLLDLAPMGDLKNCIRLYQKIGTKLNCWIVKDTLIQVAEALDYLHSKQIIYRDLKPGNVLVWRFPSPKEQWNPRASVLVKVSDYGISKKISPMGIRGHQGTAQYLPPEVNLHGGQESYSLKLDVYSFGMFMYYLFAFKSPFDKQEFIAALLREGRRPNLPTKLWPHSIPLLELMCWCWSDKPQHRPTFQQVLETLRNDATTSLIGGTPVSANNNEIQVACATTVCVPIRRHSSFAGSTSSYAQSPSQCDRLSDFFPVSQSGVGMETRVEVWYATSNRDLNIVQYRSGGATLERVKNHRQQRVSSIIHAAGHIWVATETTGLCIYDPFTRQHVAIWGEMAKKAIYRLIEVKDHQFVVALTPSNMLAFNIHDLMDNMTSAVQVLVPMYAHRFSDGEDMTRGVYVPRSEDVPTGELWVCSHSAGHFKIFSPDDLKLKENVTIVHTHNNDIRHMQAMMVNGESILLVANRCILWKWSVAGRAQLAELNIHSISSPPSPGSNTTSAHQSRITSLATWGSFAYVGTGRGSIITVNVISMDIIKSIEAYSLPTRCLITAPSSSLFTSKGSVIQDSILHSTPTMLSPNPFYNTSMSTSMLRTSDTSASLSSLTSESSPPQTNTDRCILISFGLGYCCTVGESKNCPDILTLPEGYLPCTCCNHFFTRTKPLDSTGYLLLWEMNLSQRGRTGEEEESTISEESE